MTKMPRAKRPVAAGRIRAVAKLREGKAYRAKAASCHVVEAGDYIGRVRGGVKAPPRREGLAVPAPAIGRLEPIERNRPVEEAQNLGGHALGPDTMACHRRSAQPKSSAAPPRGVIQAKPREPVSARR